MWMDNSNFLGEQPDMMFGVTGDESAPHPGGSSNTWDTYM